MAIGPNDYSGRVDDPAIPYRPKTLPKPPERNDYVLEVLLFREGIVYYNLSNATKSDVIATMDKLRNGFTKEIDGVLTAITVGNIIMIRANKKEKSVTDAVPESSQGQSTTADGVLSPPA